MKRQGVSFWKRLAQEERGQALVIVAFSTMGFIGLAGISVEASHGYLAYERLVASTNAAALAGAQAMPDTTTAAANVTAYSSVAGNKNVDPVLQNVQVTTTFLCLTTVTSTLKTPCETSNGNSGGYNALKVTQTAQVPSWFAGLFGIHFFNISASATASMRGGQANAWNIAIILDATGSMGDPDSGKQCSGTQESCALQGVQALLGDLYPCSPGQTCSSGATYVDDVSLYVFPPVLSSTASKDYCSGGTSPSHEYYEVSGLPSTWTYQVVPYSNDYRTNDAATNLSTSSYIVKATGYSGTSCSGIDATGGAGTYYAQVIYQAQSDLIAQQTANPGSKNAMIILSDGNATATVSTSSSGTYVYSSSTSGGQHPTTTYTYISSTSDLQPSSTNGLNGIPANNPTSPAYPSAVGECGQAVLAAQAAATAGTTVYTIGYGSPNTGSSANCGSDQSYSATVTTNGGSWAPGDSPCKALAAMASAPINFFSDDGDGCVAAVPSNAALTTLTSIFTQITSTFSTPILIPNGTT